MTLPLEFLHGVRFEDLPPPVVVQAQRCLLDLVGVAAGGLGTRLSAIARDHACGEMSRRDGGARLLLDGRQASPVGAAFAGAATIDSFDAHDGHRLTKGHAGVAVLPALLAYIDADFPVTSRELLTCLVVGYEIATRAGIALHGSAADYHTSGAWNTLACAAIGARLMGLSACATRHALGIAEYHGPRSQMMRCIDHPTMVKDGSAQGALSGVAAAYLARDGFTGAPAVTVEDPAVRPLWADLGSLWRIAEQYMKPYPVCRWAQPAVEAALELQHSAGVAPDAIERVRIHTFHEATRLATRAPATTEEAQYSTPYPVAAALIHGVLGADQITAEGLADASVLDLARRVELVEDAELDARFPGERWARVEFLVEGTWLHGEARPARGDPERPLGADELIQKYRGLTVPVLGEARSTLIEASVASLTVDDAAVEGLLEDLLTPVGDAGPPHSACHMSASEPMGVSQ